jgi:tetratricopeptide (TPR) repeat protein
LSPEADSSLRAKLGRDLARQASGSPFNASAKSLLANLEMTAGRYEAARKLLMEALPVDAHLPRAHERLGVLALAENRPAEAVREFEKEKSLRNPESPIDFRLGQAYQQLGDRKRAQDAYRRETRKHPDNQAAWDSLGVVEKHDG